MANIQVVGIKEAIEQFSNADAKAIVDRCIQDLAKQVASNAYY